MRGMTLAALGACVLTASTAVAQGRPFPPRRPPGGGMGQMEQPSPQQRELQRRIREELARAAREKVGLSDEQMQKLAPVNRKYAEQRRAVTVQERDVRMALRNAMMDTTSPDQAKIAEYQKQLLDLQRKRLDIVEAEQKELSSFMTPLQLAKYRALQEQVRRRVEQMRLQQQMRAGRPPMAPPPDTARRLDDPL